MLLSLLSSGQDIVTAPKHAIDVAWIVDLSVVDLKMDMCALNIVDLSGVKLAGSDG